MNGEDPEVEQMPAEVDFSRGVRGRFSGRMDHEVIVMEIDADVARVFPSSKEVNAALRMLIKATASGDLQVTVRTS